MYIYLPSEVKGISELFERKKTDKRKYLASQVSNESSFDIMVYINR